MSEGSGPGVGTTPAATCPAALVRPHRLARSPGAVPAQRWPLPVDDCEQAQLGALRLTTIGRTCGHERNVIIGYVQDGPDLVALAMNGWDEGHPSWWLNLQAHPEAVVRLGRPASATGARSRGRGVGAGAAVEALGRGQSAAGLLRRAAVDRDTRGRPRTARRDRVTQTMAHPDHRRDDPVHAPLFRPGWPD